MQPLKQEVVHSPVENLSIEKQLKESQEKFKTLFNVMPDPVVIVDGKGKFLAVNAKVEETTGFEKEELLGRNFLRTEIVTMKSKAVLIKNLAKRMLGAHINPYEIEVLTKDGKKLPFEVNATKIQFEGKAADLVILRDITERKQMENKLRRYSEHLEELVQKRTEELLESEKIYSVLVNEASDGVVILQDERIVLTNKRLLEICGYSRKELEGLHFEKLVDLVDIKYRQLIKERHERRIRGKRVPTTSELELIAKTGEHVPVEAGSTLINYQGRPATLTLLRDIRERKRMEKERLKWQRLANMGELAAMVGHDLRNPLQSIQNATYCLNNELRCLKIPRKTMEMLQIIKDSVNYADKMLRDLQDFSVAKKPLLLKININEIVKEVLSIVEAPKNLELITELSDLPEINVDKDLMKRVFLNLTLNGIQATEGRVGKLIVSTKKAKGFLEVSFKDTGVGISKDNMEKIFTPLFTTKAKGMGMGLPICRKFVEIHGGIIEVESEEGKGSTFIVKLPIQQEYGGEIVDEKQP